MSAHKAGIAGGVLMIGMAFAKVGDNCAVVAGRSARLASEGSVLDDVARVGRRVDDVGDVGGLRAPLMQGVGKPVAEFGVDLTVELVRVDPEAFPGVKIAGPTRCPRIVDLTTPSAWDRLKGGLGVACDPVVVAGLTRAPGTMLLRLADEPLAGLARDCAAAGASCVFVGCAPEGGAECLAATAASLRATKRDGRLAAFTAEFVAHALDQAPRPAFLAQLVAGDGKPRLVITQPR